MSANWYVAHTRPRCEKKLAQYCNRVGLSVTLPCYKNLRRYRGKKVTFLKVLFPGYVFLRLQFEERRLALQNDYVANLLDVPDQDVFTRQLRDILLSVESAPVCLAPEITEGTVVRIKSGPLRNLEGIVHHRMGESQIFLRLDFISRGVAVKIDASELEPV